MPYPIQRPWLRLEGGAILLAGCAAFPHFDQSLWWFAGLFFAPDLSFLGYLAGPRVGAMAYNVVHSYATYLALGALGVFAGLPLLGAIGCIGVAHVGFYRMLGYGLKAPTGFHDTHLGPIGRPVQA